MAVYADEIVLNFKEIKVVKDALEVLRKSYQVPLAFGNVDYVAARNAVQCLEQRIDNVINRWEG